MTATSRTRIECACWALLATAASAAAPAADAAASQTAAPPEFDIQEFRVLKNTVLATRQIERAVYPHLGSHRTLSDVMAARTDLEKAYRDAGYSTVYVDIPEQSVDSGIVRLTVTEGRLEHVRVTGARYFSNRRILAAVPSLQSGEVPHFPEVQKDLAQLNNESPDLRVAPILKPGSAPGTMDAQLKVSDNLPLHGSLEVNDRYTPDTTHTRLNANLSYANLFDSLQTLNLQYQVAPARSKDASVYSGTYVIPVGSSGQSLSLIALRTDSDVATVGTLAVLGKGHIYGLHYTIPFPAGGGFYPTLVLGVDLKQFNQSVLLTDSPGLETPIRYVNWSATFAATRLAAGATTSFDLGVNFGMTGIINDPAEFENERFEAKPDYMYLRFDATHEQRLWLGSRLALRLAGQYTTDPLINNEQFAMGGVDSVRGYLEAEELGDMGATGAIELRTPSLPTLFGARPQDAYLYVFYNGGITEIIDPLPQQERRAHLLSWGVGLRLFAYRGIDAGLDWALPRVTTSNTTAGRSRGDFRLRYGF